MNDTLRETRPAPIFPPPVLRDENGSTDALDRFGDYDAIRWGFGEATELAVQRFHNSGSRQRVTCAYRDEALEASRAANGGTTMLGRAFLIQSER